MPLRRALQMNVLVLMPKVAQMAAWARCTTLPHELNSRHVLLLPLLRWLISTNRAHVRILDKHEV